MMTEYYVVLFFSNNNTLWLARVLKNADIERKMIPVPRSLSSQCGYCVRVKSQDIERVVELIKEYNIVYDKIEHI